MRVQFSVLAMAAAGVSANSLFGRQTSSSSLQGDVIKALTSELSELGDGAQLPEQCKASCEPLSTLAKSCSTSASESDDNSTEACLKGFCQKDQIDNMVKCQDCIAENVPSAIDPEDKDGLAKLVEGLKTACKESGNPVEGDAASSGASTTTHSPSSTSAPASETTNAALAGVQVGMGAIMVALGLVAATL